MVQVNAIGDACPIPVIKTLHALQDLNGAGTVQTLVDNEIAVQNLTRLAESKGCSITTEKRSDKEFCVTITTENSIGKAEADEQIACTVPADRQGNIRYEDMETLFRPETKAVVCTHASNLTGNLLDIAKIGAMAHAHGALLVADASQTAGAVPIDMQRMNIDVLCFTGHKGLMGPQGTGGLCIRPGVELRPLLRGGTGIHSYDREQPQAYPARLEAGTLNTHGIAGLHAALKFIEKQTVQAIGARERALMRRFYDGVKDLDGVTVYGDFSQSERAAVVALNIRDYDSAEVADALFADYDIATRAGAHCAPRMHEALGTVQQGAVRFSFSYFNTENEVDTAIAAVRELAE